MIFFRVFLPFWFGTVWYTRRDDGSSFTYARKRDTSRRMSGIRALAHFARMGFPPAPRKVGEKAAAEAGIAISEIDVAHSGRIVPIFLLRLRFPWTDLEISSTARGPNPQANVAAGIFSPAGPSHPIFPTILSPYFSSTCCIFAAYPIFVPKGGRGQSKRLSSRSILSRKIPRITTVWRKAKTP